MFRRYLQLLRLFLLRDGGKRAAYCKKTGYFHAQGEGCYFQIYNFGVEPHLLSFGSNVKVASGVRFITHDIFGDVILYKNNMDQHIRRVGKITIGNNVLIAPNVQIYTATHSIKINERMVHEWSESEEICRTYALPVKIEDGVWIGGGSIILPGVIIGQNSVIGAGSVVTHSIPANCVAVGNPCRIIKQINNE